MGGGTGDSIDGKVQDKYFMNMHISERKEHDSILFEEQESKENYNSKQNIFQRIYSSIRNYFK